MTDETPEGTETTETPEPAPAAEVASAEEVAAQGADTAVPPAAETEAPAPAAAEPPAAAPPPTRRGGVLVPLWALVLVGVLAVGGLGFVIGYAVAPGDEEPATDAVSEAPSGVPAPGPVAPPGGGQGQVPTGRVLLGVAVVPATGDQEGAEIVRVGPASPAAQAGLEVGDVITEVDGDAVASAADLVEAIGSHDRGDRVEITYVRDGSSETVDVQLGRTSASGTDDTDTVS